MKIQRALSIVLALIFIATGCNARRAATASPQTTTGPSGRPVKTYEDLVVGFAQIGAESEWRSANTQDIKEEADRLGIELKFSDAQQKQENQILAVRKFIIEKVDVIGISPVVETGWDEVFQEAKEAGIPIILVDRRAAVPEDLYVTYLGSDFLEEGKNAAREMIKLTDGNARIVELQGTPGSAPATDRYNGFREVIRDYPNMVILDSQNGDFTRARGREVMADFLKVYGDTITALYAHNDDMALGAIQAIEEHGLKPGVDIQIVSVDAARVALQAIIDGKMNVSVECNPLLGNQFFELALQVVNGEIVHKWVPSIETIFDINNAAEALPSRKY
jgi:ABC-type sugar transport system substrate-binding protein